MNTTRKKIGLALSGGGYRAAAYHIGTLRALHRLGILNKVDVISSVSGGSITAAYYALNKDNYEDFEKSFTQSLSKGVLWLSITYLIIVSILLLATSILLSHITARLMNILFPHQPIFSGICAALVGVLGFFLLLIYCLKHSFVTIPTSKFVSRLYNKVFFKGKTLSDLPDTPSLCINSTNIATQRPFFFSKKDMGEHAYRINGRSIFNTQDFPIASAVMASSCVPYGFTPITIDKKHLTEDYSQCPNKPEAPKLIDGGVYDNQGGHKLSQDKSRFHTDFIIVSDAGNSVISADKTKNIFSLAMSTISLMMDRVKKMQRAENLYQTYIDKEYFAYVPLEWKCSERLIHGFVNNLKDDNVHPDVWQAHAITEEDIAQLKGLESKSAYTAIIEKIKKSINWTALEQKIPQKESEEIARSVGTSLTALSPQEIKSLTAHSAWLTEFQVRLYMPMLITAEN